MKPDYTIRQATKSDYMFLAEAVIKADLGTEGKNSSYAALLGVSNETAINSIAAMMDEEVGGCEFCPTTFLVAEYENKPVACVSSWIEGENGISSWQIRTALIREYFPKGSIEHILKLSDLTNEVMVHRTDGALQIESVFVSPEHRGQGLAADLIKAHVVNAHNKNTSAKIVELMTYTNNESAINSYSKLGFSVISKTCSNDSKALDFFPHNSMVLMQVEFEKLLKLIKI